MKRHIFILSVIGIALFSCSEDTPEPKEVVAPSTTSTQENTQIQSNFDDVNRLIQIAFENARIGNNDTKDTSNVGCYEVFVDIPNKTAEVVFDENIICLDGKKRKGKFEISYTAAYRTSGSVIVTELVGYEVNGVKLEGTKTVTNKGVNTDGNLEYQISVTNAKRTGIDGKVTTWTSERTREWIAGSSTALDVTDDVYLIYGTAEGTNSGNQNFTVNTNESEALKLDVACWLTNRIPVSGKVNITPDGEDTRTIDYGDGTCNKKITLSYLGLSFDITSGVN